jgi:lipid A 3-O-deacylase
MSGRSVSFGTCCLASLLLSGGRLSAVEPEPGQPASWTLYVENDSFLSTDRYYTNGIRLTRSFSPDGFPRWAHRTRWMERVVDHVPHCSSRVNDGSCYNFETAWTFGQNLYTPDDIRASSLIPDQRPYGAWLYYGNILTLSKPDRQHSLEIDAGAVGGSLALGGTVQSGWHALLRAVNNSDTPPDPKGWGNQINNQPGLQLLYQCRRRFIERRTRSDLRYFDLVPQINAALGTVSDYASVGATVRLGYNLPNEFPELIPPFLPSPEPSGSPGAASLASYRRHPLLARPVTSPSVRRWEAYLFARADQRYVAYSAFLDGNIRLFGRSHSVPKEPLVTDLQAGAVLGCCHWRLSVTYVDRSPEFRAQRGHQDFLSITVLHRR